MVREWVHHAVGGYDVLETADARCWVGPAAPGRWGAQVWPYADPLRTRGAEFAGRAEALDAAGAWVAAVTAGGG